MRMTGAIWVFLSWGAGWQSDVDVLADFTAEADLLDLVGLAQLLEERLQRPVDVVPRAALRAEA